LVTRGLIVGVDGGGSKTDIALCTLEGQVLASTTCDGTRIESIDPASVIVYIWKKISILIQKIGFPIESLQSACLGMGGLDTGKKIRETTNIAKDVFPKHCKLIVCNDGQVALYSGTFGKPGLAVVAGTGSLVVGMDSHKEWYRSGGWGSLFGDEGSAFSIARLAIRAALKAADGSGPPTALTDEISKALKLNEIGEVVDYFGWEYGLVSCVASLAPLVDRVASTGDKVAREIVTTEANVLARDTYQLAKKLMRDRGVRKIRLVLVGGMFRSQLFRETFISTLLKRTPKMQVILPQWKSVVGALIFSFERLNLMPSPETIRGITENLRWEDYS